MPALFRAALIASALTLPAALHAQTDDSSLPPATCIKPTVPAPSATLDEAASKKLNTESTAYQTCIDAYLKARRAVAAKYGAISKAHSDAANAQALEFNGFADRLQAFAAAQKKQASDKADEPAPASHY